MRLAAVFEQGFDDCVAANPNIEKQDEEATILDIDENANTNLGINISSGGVSGDDVAGAGSVNAALQFLGEFGSLLERETLRSMLQQKFPNLLRAFMKELDQVKKLFCLSSKS